MITYRQLGKYIEVDPGVELYYEDRGSGSPIVFIPAWTFTTEIFDYQIEHFSKSHRVIAFDPRSQGRSSVTLHGNDYTTHATDLAKLIQALDLKNVVLVGWSAGCLTAWGYVRQEGTKALKAVVSIDLSPKPLSINAGDWVEGSLDDIGGTYNAFFRSSQGQRDFVTGYVKDLMIQRPLTDEELAWIVGQSLKTPYYIASALFASVMFSNYMVEAKLVDEKLPALSIIAEHWSNTAVPFMQKHFPRTKTAVLGGHMMFWEYPEKFNKILGDFIASL